MGWEEDYKAKLRDFMARKGTPAVINRDGGWYGRVSVYGWISMDYRHKFEGEGCSWVVPEGARLEEHTYSLFADTFSGNKEEVGVEVYPVHCACGKLVDVTLRYVGSLGDVLHDILGIDDSAGIDL